TSLYCLIVLSLVVHFSFMTKPQLTNFVLLASACPAGKLFSFVHFLCHRLPVIKCMEQMISYYSAATVDR
ncbi:hypothetical protein, partial [Neisseria meningitidis]|uniref:hypothetical protein n=1 Tax=Neisseria meningitidis TaxID=487 RepID=UPI001C5BC58C